jgi:predicted RecA/RadA family phage recombinase
MANGSGRIMETVKTIVWVNGGSDVKAHSFDGKTGVISLPGRYGMATTDIAAGASGVVQIDGRWYLAKATGDTFAAGQWVWWSTVTLQVTATHQSGRPPIGTVAKAVGTGVTLVEIDLNVHGMPVVFKQVVTAAQDAANAAVIGLGTGADPSVIFVTIRSVADPAVLRFPDSVDINAGTGVITVNDANLAENEVIQIIYSPY